MKPFTYAFALMACTGLAFAQNPVTPIGKGPQKQIENKGLSNTPKQEIFTRPASSSGGTFFAGANGSDDCATATAISGSGSWPCDTTAATTSAEGQSSCYAFGTSAIPLDIWYEWTADVTGDAVVGTCNTINWDSKIAVYAGAGCPAPGTLVGCNDDASGCAGFSSQTSFSCTAGSVYMIQLGAYGPSTSNGTGTINCTIIPSITPRRSQVRGPSPTATSARPRER